jgi:hypothetical protein
MAHDVPENPPGTRGLRRDPALVPFSRDHHFALMQAQALARAARADEALPLKRACEEYLRWFAGEGEPHFADEEGVLLPALETSDPAGVARVRAQHAELRALGRRLSAASGDATTLPALAAQLGALLHDHVRFEERALFEAAQRALPADVLAGLGRELAKRREARGGAPACPTRVPDSSG